MTNTHERAAASLMDRMLTHPDDGPALIELNRRVRAGQVPAAYLAVIGQPDPRTGWPMEQVAALMSVHARLGSGDLVRVQIALHETPGSDRDGRRDNAAVIGDLPHPFTGSVDLEQNAAPGGDGLIAWAEPIESSRSTGEATDDGGRVFVPYSIRPRSGIPLEIGSTKASVTAAHLAASGAVARWPYGSPTLTIIIDSRFGDAGPVPGGMVDR